MTIHVDLSQDMQAFVRAKVENGIYDNEIEVIQDALRRMQTEEARVASFRVAIAEAEAEIEAGEGLIYRPDTMSSIIDNVMASRKTRV